MQLYNQRHYGIIYYFYILYYGIIYYILYTVFTHNLVVRLHEFLTKFVIHKRVRIKLLKNVHASPSVKIFECPIIRKMTCRVQA